MHKKNTPATQCFRFVQGLTLTILCLLCLCFNSLQAQPKTREFKFLSGAKAGSIPATFNLTIIPDDTVVLCAGDTLKYSLIQYNHIGNCTGLIQGERYVITTHALNSVANISYDSIQRGSILMPIIACNTGLEYTTLPSFSNVASNIQNSFFIYTKIICSLVDGSRETYHLTRVLVATSPKAPKIINVTPTPTVPPGGKATLQVVDTDPTVDYAWYKQPNAGSLLDVKNPFTTDPLMGDVNFYVVAQEKTGVGSGLKCGSAFTTVPVFVRNQFFIPNAFSPNNDGLNDVFKIEGKTITSGTLSIYDSWGNLIFKTNDITKGWDGYREGKLQPAGTYVYLTTGTYINGKSFTFKGSVTLIR